MTNDTRAIVTEDWQYDALRIILVNPHARTVSKVIHLGNTIPPILRMEPYEPTDTQADDDAGIRLPYPVARDLYEALARHFGDRPDPGSRELVETLGTRLEREEARVDRLLDYALAPPMILPSMTATVHGDQG